MTGFENTANVAEETIDPYKAFPRSLIGGMVVAGLVYVLVSMAAALTVPTDTLAELRAALLEVVKQGILPFSTDLMTTLFTIIALIAITNTTLVTVVTQPRILYGMANEDVVPGVFAKIHPTRRSPWVGLLFSGVVVGRLLVIGTPVTEAGGGIDLVDRLAPSPWCSCSHLRPGDRRLPQAARPGRGRADVPGQHARCSSLGLLGNLAILVLRDLRRPELADLVRRPARRRRGALPGRAASSAAAGTGRRTAPTPRRRSDMHVIVATDGSKQSLAAARHLSPSPTRPRSPTSRWSR